LLTILILLKTLLIIHSHQNFHSFFKAMKNIEVLSGLHHKF